MHIDPMRSGEVGVQKIAFNGFAVDFHSFHIVAGAVHGDVEHGISIVQSSQCLIPVEA